MAIRTILYKFIRVVSDEALRNPEFAERLQQVLEPRTQPRSRPTRGSGKRGIESGTSRPRNRRPAAVLDPIALAQQGEEVLRAALSPLTLDQLKNVVADYGMDQKRLAMKWKTPSRVIDRIVEVSINRAHKGEAFR